MRVKLDADIRSVFTATAVARNVYGNPRGWRTIVGAPAGWGGRVVTWVRNPHVITMTSRGNGLHLVEVAGEEACTCVVKSRGTTWSFVIVGDAHVGERFTVILHPEEA